MKPIRHLIGIALFCSAASAWAGYFEVSANGSYVKYNNGVQDGTPSNTTVTRVGAGLAYRFLANTSIEFSYVNSKTFDSFGQDIVSEAEIFFIDRKTEMQNFSTNLVLHFTDRKSRFRPYVLGGVGYMIRKQSFSGRATDKITDAERALSFASSAPLRSMSADAGIGLSIYILDQIALEASYTIYATDLNKSEIFLHYSIAGGVRVLF